MKRVGDVLDGVMGTSGWLPLAMEIERLIRATLERRYPHDPHKVVQGMDSGDAWRTLYKICTGTTVKTVMEACTDANVPRLIVMRDKLRIMADERKGAA